MRTQVWSSWFPPLDALGDSSPEDGLFFGTCPLLLLLLLILLLLRILLLLLVTPGRRQIGCQHQVLHKLFSTLKYANLQEDKKKLRKKTKEISINPFYIHYITYINPKNLNWGHSQNMFVFLHTASSIDPELQRICFYQRSNKKKHFFPAKYSSFL